ncbi:MAG: hypothetical protein RI968_771 [Pseudomonadota bacterium]
MTFQSRFGKAKWLEPYTEPTLIALAQKGIRTMDVACPGFTSDCLETLEEINMEGREEFLEAGGESYNYIACLNDSEPAIDLLARLIEEETAGWPTQEESKEAMEDRRIARDRALAIGAAD